MLITPALGGGDTQLRRPLLNGLPTQPLGGPDWAPGKQQTNIVDSLRQTRLKVRTCTNIHTHTWTPTYMCTYTCTHIHTKKGQIIIQYGSLKMELISLSMYSFRNLVLSLYYPMGHVLIHMVQEKRRQCVTLSSVYSTLALDPEVLPLVLSSKANPHFLFPQIQSNDPGD